MSTDKQEKLNQQIRSVLDQSVEDLDDKTCYRLQMVRADVLNAQTKSKWWSKWPMSGGMAGFASITALLAFIFISQPHYISENSVKLTAVDAVLFDADTNIELYEQYEFYVWLSEQETKS